MQNVNATKHPLELKQDACAQMREHNSYLHTFALTLDPYNVLGLDTFVWKVRVHTGGIPYMMLCAIPSDACNAS